MRIRDVRLGSGEPLALISGLNVIESLVGTLDIAHAVQGVAERHGIPVVFKASFDKANRTSRHSFRGVGLDEGLHILACVKRETGLPILTDVHEPGQAKIVAEVADCLQIPAFLARQTDLVAACAATGRALNVKKAQYMAPDDLLCAVEKAQSFGAENVLVTERGSMFGYNDLVVDLRGFAAMRRIAPLCFDATHAAQHPGAGGASSTGNRDVVAPLARAAVAVGVDALFVEVHQDPGCAPCDGQCQIRIEDLDRLLGEVCAIGEALA
ncbi:MAG: 3-deoxy-8-phosphooctulonate synthase [Myxococcota bacterium]|jgi:2-dehydro-3-deoxyphosphooctonate aldolase (KDO 8-P synthase)|nr:3-deoxy-8-phosphooctulonate synthase [Deltaproteobacteria bacterium]MCP4241689.1 3-deoxy-8-phosphooctulonate synthase [bacterium]MDP6075186.1 3-deoxy-8-phosphooctulonate synthase [Myxococcota bacterium]MDP6243835.1 3-deoxy-8-phosphooctulonate synthase [Myxococcota bacterium]MDP7075895.1 3-deoxy-8-phosphooctulonate synthase [Myxococcota bacterium]